SINTLPGFEVQLIYSVPRESQGSWVSLTVGPEGQLYASDQQGEGMYQVTVGDSLKDTDVDVKELIMPVSGAQGQVWAFDYLYMNINGKWLFRMEDTNIDDQFDMLEYLGGPPRRGEHGNHAILPASDGEGLYVLN